MVSRFIREIVQLSVGYLPFIKLKCDGGGIANDLRLEELVRTNLGKFRVGVVPTIESVVPLARCRSVPGENIAKCCHSDLPTISFMISFEPA